MTHFQKLIINLHMVNFGSHVDALTSGSVDASLSMQGTHF